MKIPRQLYAKPVRLAGDKRGVSVLVEYILLIGVLSLVLAFTVPQLSNLMSKLPTQNAMSNQFQDVASEISAKLTDMLLIAPKNGVVKSKVYMPESVGKHTYSVEVKNGELVVKSNLWTQKVDLGESTLGFITKGRTFSSEFSHEIMLNSSTYLLPTAVAIVYPTKAAVNESITFDMTHSYGEGTLYYRWDFGDGTTYPSTGWAKYDPMNPLTGVVHHSYSSAGNYTVELQVKDSLGFISSAFVHVNVTEIPKATLYVQKYVVPATIPPGGTSKISIFLFGNGINQTSRNITIVHTIDTSGSMSDLTPLVRYKGSISSKPAVISFYVPPGNYYLNVSITTPDFNNIMKNYGIEPIGVYIKSPDQNYYTQITHLWIKHEWWFRQVDLGYEYTILNLTGLTPGVWKIAINDLLPWSSETATVYISTLGFQPVSTTKTATVYPTYVAYGAKVPNGATKVGAIVSPTQTTSDNLCSWLKNNITGQYYHNTSDINTSIAPAPPYTYTALVVPNLPPNTTESYYLDVGIPKLDAAKIATKTFNGILKKNPYNFVGLVNFSGYSAYYLVNPPTNNTDVVNASLDTLTAEGATPMALGLEYAIKELDNFNNSKNSPAVDVIILLTDGRPNVDLNGTYYRYNTTPAIRDTIHEAYQAKKKGYIIYTIGYGTDVNSTLLQQIADITGGKYYFAANAQELESIYKSIARDILTKVAENVTINDVVPKGIEVVGTSGAKVVSTANGTLVQWSVPVVRINQSWLGTITITTSQTGVLTTDVLNVSNVTYYSVVEKKTVVVPLPAREINVSVRRYASFELK